MMKTDEVTQKLIDAALKVRENAYAPYSGYAVGAAVLADSGTVYTGANVENAAYPMTICGERNAIFHAVAEGERNFTRIVIATRNGGAPCGACRQVMAEFAPEMEVLLVDEQGTICRQTTVSELLPGAFTPKSLQ